MKSMRAPQSRQAALVRRMLLLGIAAVFAGCTAMMLGGANTGGYEPPKDECTDERAAAGRCSAEQPLD